MKDETARREIESLDYYLQNHTDDYSEESHTAMMMAIKALEQQPCEDCISRQAVLDVINFEDKWLFDANGHNANTHIAFSGLESRVKALPPVTPQRPKGKWIEIEIDAGEFIYKCTKCGMRVINPYKYCPNCGSYNAEIKEKADD